MGEIRAADRGPRHHPMASPVPSLGEDYVRRTYMAGQASRLSNASREMRLMGTEASADGGDLCPDH